MGRLGKKMVNRIRAMLAEGYSYTETAEELGVNRKTVASYAVDDAKSSLVQDESGKMVLPMDNEITKILYDMQGVMGSLSLVDAVKQAYQDEVSLAKLKVTHWSIYADEEEEFTAEAMVQHLVGFIDYLETDQREWANSLRDANAENERLKEFAEERYEEGFEQGEQDNAIYVKCAHCGKPYQVTPQTEIHGVVSQVLQELGWGHISCARRDEYSRNAGSRALEAALRGS